ncbi:MAG: hypothetical protein BroJett031_35630 [Betaproteobacteria bacterium]|jgi:hypothetical protein|nr:MAG: hypothetical protein BroJett031_35630 [Betaproteobacteria bacterium]
MNVRPSTGSGAQDEPRNDCIDLATPHRGLACRPWAQGRPHRWRFTVSVRDRSGNVLVFATGGPDDVAPRVDRNDDGSRSLWLASACIELRGDADALAAEWFIAQHAPSRGTASRCPYAETEIGYAARHEADSLAR